MTGFASPRRMEPSEHQIQSAFIRWMRVQHPSIICIAIPNAARRSYALAGRMKAEGMLAGTPDVFIARPNRIHGGLWLEFKSAKGRLSDDQMRMLADLNMAGYRVGVPRSFEEARELTIDYLGVA